MSARVHGSSGSDHYERNGARPKYLSFDKERHGNIPPQVITSWMKGAKSGREVFDICEKYMDSLNRIHFSAAFTCLRKMEMESFSSHEQDILQKLQKKVKEQAKTFEPLGIANTVYSLSKLPTFDAEVFSQFERELFTGHRKTKLEKCSFKDLAMIAFAYSKVQGDFNELYQAIEKEVLSRRSSEIDVQSIPLFMNGFVQARRTSKKLFGIFEKAILEGKTDRKSLQYMDGKQCAFALFAFAQAGTGTCKLFFTFEEQIA